MDSKKEYCGPVAIENCAIYSNDLQDCLQCFGGEYFIEQKKCCSSEDTFLDENNNEICVPGYIPGCNRYLSSDPSKCYKCY